MNHFGNECNKLLRKVNSSDERRNKYFCQIIWIVHKSTVWVTKVWSIKLFGYESLQNTADDSKNANSIYSQVDYPKNSYVFVKWVAWTIKGLGI